MNHTLPHSISNCIITDAIYDTEDETTVEKFLRESTANKNKIAITTDLNKQYILFFTVKPIFDRTKYWYATSSK